ncbi:hypothetical protein ACFL35_17455 [Candidatus Riflebacteria bacterium]
MERVAWGQGRKLSGDRNRISGEWEVVGCRFVTQVLRIGDGFGYGIGAE